MLEVGSACFIPKYSQVVVKMFVEQSVDDVHLQYICRMFQIYCGAFERSSRTIVGLCLVSDLLGYIVYLYFVRIINSETRILIVH